jgi:Ni,Fe-hydrogenase III large subunit
MSRLVELIAGGTRITDHHPWPRVTVPHEAWEFAGRQLAAREWTLVAHWAEPGAVHLALYEPATGELGVITFEAGAGQFPSIGRVHPPARRLERTIHDLYGIVAEGAPDARPWLDHACWPSAHPLNGAGAAAKPEAYRFLPVEGESLHEIPVGPVHAGIIEPGHFRFTANGETVVRLEERLGYVHKGIEGLMRDAPLERAARLAGRVSGDTTVAYAIAFARAVEAATGTTVPPRAQWLRALMLELERVANHFGDWGAVCNDAAFSIMHARCGVQRERVLRAAHAAFGHRLMMDCVVPGGAVAEPDAKALRNIERTIRYVRRRLPALIRLYENTASLQDRTVGTGVVSRALAEQWAAGGHIGRASGRDFDARRAFPFAPYGSLEFDVPVLAEGDVNARVWVRIREIEQSLALIEQVLDILPDGAVRAPVREAAGEGAAMVEGFRGDIFAWVRMEAGGTVARAHLRDPSWFQWPLLEAAIENNIVADFPLCNKSFNCSYAGHDL